MKFITECGHYSTCRCAVKKSVTHSLDLSINLCSTLIPRQWRNLDNGIGEDLDEMAAVVWSSFVLQFDHWVTQEGTICVYSLADFLDGGVVVFHRFVWLLTPWKEELLSWLVILCWITQLKPSPESGKEESEARCRQHFPVGLLANQQRTDEEGIYAGDICDRLPWPWNHNTCGVRSASQLHRRPTCRWMMQ